jgi:hypothetical protein
MVVEKNIPFAVLSLFFCRKKVSTAAFNNKETLIIAEMVVLSCDKSSMNSLKVKKLNFHK